MPTARRPQPSILNNSRVPPCKKGCGQSSAASPKGKPTAIPNWLSKSSGPRQSVLWPQLVGATPSPFWCLAIALLPNQDNWGGTIGGLTSKKRYSPGRRRLIILPSNSLRFCTNLSWKQSFCQLTAPKNCYHLLKRSITA